MELHLHAPYTSLWLRCVFRLGTKSRTLGPGSWDCFWYQRGTNIGRVYVEATESSVLRALEIRGCYAGHELARCRAVVWLLRQKGFGAAFTVSVLFATLHRQTCRLHVGCCNTPAVRRCEGEKVKVKFAL